MIEFGKENQEGITAPFLIKAMEEMDNRITLIVALPMEGEKRRVSDEIGLPALKEVLANCTPIVPDEDHMYQITFEQYILHQTRNESYASWDNAEVRKGKSFIVFERSGLLDALPDLVDLGIVNAYHPEGYRHYGIYCQNHVIDIISAKEPVITKLR